MLKHAAQRLINSYSVLDCPKFAVFIESYSATLTELRNARNEILYLSREISVHLLAKCARNTSVLFVIYLAEVCNKISFYR